MHSTALPSYSTTQRTYSTTQRTNQHWIQAQMTQVGADTSTHPHHSNLRLSLACVSILFQPPAAAAHLRPLATPRMHNACAGLHQMHHLMMDQAAQNHSLRPSARLAATCEGVYAHTVISPCTSPQSSGAALPNQHPCLQQNWVTLTDATRVLQQISSSKNEGRFV
jgi:hypothetical protein